MTRQERLTFCKKCIHRQFDPSQGMICGLTAAVADFDSHCPDYAMDKSVALDQSPALQLKPNDKRAKVAIYMIGAVLVVSLFSAVASYFQYTMLEDFQNGFQLSDSAVAANDLRVGLLALLYLVVYGISAVTFIQWFRRAYNNLAARTTINHSEGWAAGSWFVPIICLYRPYRIMKELFEETNRLIADRTESFAKGNEFNLIGIWWTLWILVGFIGNYSLRLTFREETIENLTNSTLVDITTSLMEIPIGILAILIIAAFAKREKQLLQLEGEERQHRMAA